MSCQKVVNVLAVASFAVSGAVVVSGIYVYVNKDSILDGVKSQVMDAVTGSLGGLGAGGLAPELPTGTNDIGGIPDGQASAGSIPPVVSSF